MGGLIGVLTIGDTLAQFTKREVKRTEEAARLARYLEYLSNPVTNRTLWSGSVERTRLTAIDCEYAEDVLGKPIEFIPGKSEKQYPLVSRFAPIKRVREPCQQDTYIFFFGMKPFLFSALMPLGFGIKTWMNNNRSASISKDVWESS